jgi:hypothetical protein
VYPPFLLPGEVEIPPHGVYVRSARVSEQRQRSVYFRIQRVRAEVKRTAAAASAPAQNTRPANPAGVNEVCVCVCVFACVRAYVRVCVFVCVCARVCVWVCARLWVCVRVRARACIHARLESVGECRRLLCGCGVRVRYPGSVRLQ